MANQVSRANDCMERKDPHKAFRIVYVMTVCFVYVLNIYLKHKYEKLWPSTYFLFLSLTYLTLFFCLSLVFRRHKICSIVGVSLASILLLGPGLSLLPKYTPKQAKIKIAEEMNITPNAFLFGIGRPQFAVYDIKHYLFIYMLDYAENVETITYEFNPVNGKYWENNSYYKLTYQDGEYFIDHMER